MFFHILFSILSWAGSLIYWLVAICKFVLFFCKSKCVFERCKEPRGTWFDVVRCGLGSTLVQTMWNSQSNLRNDLLEVVKSRLFAGRRQNRCVSVCLSSVHLFCWQWKPIALRIELFFFFFSLFSFFLLTFICVPLRYFILFKNSFHFFSTCRFSLSSFFFFLFFMSFGSQIFHWFPHVPLDLSNAFSIYGYERWSHYQKHNILVTKIIFLISHVDSEQNFFPPSWISTCPM